MLRLNDFECPICGTVRETLSRDGEAVLCRICQNPMDKLPPVFKINMGPAGAYGYYDENLDTYVETNAHRRELCRRQGVTPKGETPKPDGGAWV